MREKYAEIISRYNDEQTWDKYFSRDLHDTSKIHPQTLAAVVGQLAPSTGGLSLLTRGPLVEGVYEHVARTIENRDRVKIGMPFVLAAYSPAAFSLFPALAPTAASIPQMPTLERYSGQLKADLQETMVSSLFRRDMGAFRDQLTKLSSEKKNGKEKKIDEIRKDVDDYVKQFVKDRGLQYGVSRGPTDRYSITLDPGLKPLVDKMPAPISPVESNPWIRAFFANLDPNNTTATQPGVLYSPKWFPPKDVDPRMFGPNVNQQILEFLSDQPPSEPKEVGYLAWRSDYVRPISATNYDTAPANVKEKVLQAWKYGKARELAKKEADTLAETIRGIAKKQLQEANNSPAFLNELREKTAQFKKIDLTRVAQIQEQPSTDPRMAREYVEFDLPKKEIYFPGNMRKELLDLRTKPVGETIVVNDDPKSHFFVASMVDKKEPTFANFVQEVFSKSASKLEQDPLYDRYVASISAKFFQTVMDRIKVEAKFKESDEFKKMNEKVEKPDLE